MAIDKKAILDELEHYNVQQNFEYSVIQFGFEWISQNPHYLYNMEKHYSGSVDIVKNMHLSRIGTCLKYVNHTDPEVKSKADYGLHLAIAGLIEAGLVLYVYNNAPRNIRETMSLMNLGTASSSSPTVKYYYAVAVGRNPGIYTTWEDCKRETHGFSNAIFKKFPTLEQASEYLEDYR